MSPSALAVKLGVALFDTMGVSKCYNTWDIYTSALLRRTMRGSGDEARSVC